ncbi:MAG: threonine synthase [Gemmatimonadota bacterium]
MTSFSLECGACGESPEVAPGASVCPACAKPLLVHYALDGMDGPELIERWSRRPCDVGMWRFREILPIADGETPVSLGEGATPLLPLGDIDGLQGLLAYVKDEGRNPTGSFKDRGLSAAVTRAVLDGASSFVVPSAGNAGVSLAAYASRAGKRARVYLPADTPEMVVRRTRAAGGEVRRVDGLITDCGAKAREYAARTEALDFSTLREPYRIEGKKTMMLEIVQALGWRAPDAIVYPTGGGTGLIGSWKALGELAAMGIAVATTRCYAVQAGGCAPIVRAFGEGALAAEPWIGAQTRAYGLRVPSTLGDALILKALRESGGGALAVSDEESEAAAVELGKAGVSASIEGGATLAAARRLREEGQLVDDETVVLFNTAHALVY